MSAAQPAPSLPLPEVDPVLREEFDRHMQGFALALETVSASNKDQRDRRNAVQGARTQKVRSLAEIPALFAAPSVPSVPHKAPELLREGNMYEAVAKPQPRRMMVSPKPSHESTLTARASRRLRLYRQSLLSLFLTPADALEECPVLTSHMLPVVVM